MCQVELIDKILDRYDPGDFERTGFPLSNDENFVAEGFAATGLTATRLARSILHAHGEAVCKMSLDLANRLMQDGYDIDVEFLAEAAVLHDIGIVAVNAPRIGCYGRLPYVWHGIMGKRILETCGMPRHARVCARHVGAGLLAKDVARISPPMPMVDMLPETLEEKIICYADKFHSKTPPPFEMFHSLKEVLNTLSRHGDDKVERFLALQEVVDPTQRLERYSRNYKHISGRPEMNQAY